MLTRSYYVCIMASASKRLYVGVTNNLQRRIHEHRGEGFDAFTKRYCITRLVYFEQTQDVASAILREKQIKGWVRAKKVALVKQNNPEWNDLYTDLFGSETTLKDSSGC